MMLYPLIFLVSCLSVVSNNLDVEKISWSETNKLTWANFKGKPDKASNAAASTASGISFGYKIKTTNNKITGFTTTVNSVFYPTKSWYKVEDATDHILAHEQMHFNITELYARKFRKQLSEVKISTRLKLQLSNLYKSINEASNKMQKFYDKETKHSIDKTKQAEWNTYIRLELQKLDKYKTQ